jgi:hypothetical protein
MSDHTKLFEKDVGTWDGEIEVRVDPAAEPQRSSGVMTNQLIGDRWLVTEFKNETTGFEARGIYGWDDAQQAYVGTWIDSMRSSLVIGQGTLDLDSNTMTYRFEVPQGDKIQRWRDVTHFVDDDNQVFRSFLELHPGKEHAVVTAKYRRRR